MERMKENYQTAAGYHTYFQSVVTFYNSSLQDKQNSLYHKHFYTLHATTEELQHSIANMVSQGFIQYRSGGCPRIAPSSFEGVSLQKFGNIIVICDYFLMIFYESDKAEKTLLQF